ncbi:MAG: hypothetical protein WBD22_09075 [Pyrinomonadaceae bacterium]
MKNELEIEEADLISCAEPTEIVDDGSGPNEMKKMDDLQTENDSLRQLIRLRDAREVITAQLVKAGARSPGLLFAYGADKLQFTSDGELANAAAIVEALRRNFPEQFAEERTATADGGAGASNTAAWLSKDALARMSPREIAQLEWADVRRVISEE